MKLRIRISGAIAAALLLGSLLPTVAQAATDPPTLDDLSAEQQQAIAAWESGGTNMSTASGDANVTSRTAVASVAATSGTNSMKLYRGSWLMWAEENVSFGYGGGSVTWSDAFQQSGWVIPNTVKQNGTKRIYTTSARHDWRGSYTVGAGVPTPWGNANVYSATSNAFSRVLNVGSYQKWED
ncbi:hypothetical protein [Microbacterium natoriense]|nr:hypothetical protein [Microbacterium natoriense]